MMSIEHSYLLRLQRVQNSSLRYGFLVANAIRAGNVKAATFYLDRVNDTYAEGTRIIDEASFNAVKHRFSDTIALREQIMSTSQSFMDVNKMRKDAELIKIRREAI